MHHLNANTDSSKFIIQADWDTDANRQDIVTTSPRNVSLRSGITDAFIKAVLQFCKHDTLQYRWMRYLPQKNSFPWDSFWKKLVAGIENEITSTPVMRSREIGVLRPINKLRYRLDKNNDENGDPLFADLPTELYLSDNYLPEDRRLLKDFGLHRIYMDEVVQLVEQDLKLACKGKSRMRGKDTDDDWHTRAAILLRQPFENGSQNTVNQIKWLDLIPLQDGCWVSAAAAPIYFPTVDGIPIPQDLGLRLVDPAAAKNARRAELFKYLDVETAKVKSIRSKILAMYDTTEGCKHITLDISREHLHFLYLTHRAAKETDCSNRIRIYDRVDDMCHPGSVDLHIPDDHPYGPRVLLGDDGIGNDTEVYLVADSYLDNVPEKAPGVELAWAEWMHKYIGVQRHLRLVNNTKSELSLTCRWVAKNRPNKFLGFLKHLWPFEGKLALGLPTVLCELSGILVPCMGDHDLELSQTYLPLPNLQKFCKRFIQEDEFFPFVKLPADIDGDSLLERWSFLTEFGVGVKDNLEFRLKILFWVRTLNLGASATRNISRVVDLYLSIDASHQDSGNQAKGKKNIKSDKQIDVSGLLWILTLG